MLHPQAVFKIDQFTVPAPSRTEFLQRVSQTLEVLRAQRGFVQDFLLEHQTENPASSTIITIVEWENPEVMPAARAAVQAFHQNIGLDATTLYDRLGIKADLKNYQQVL
ncbi:antibiotic biosynthesis monooxygenase [Deinococcus roseus]|uniref:ABM domain-containing protein n=1 Tax=Deinococcus roseus TaxID=392414 RepID=A0ABQ2D1E8_9DEIO|nr:antibiotic biosynthesis monooxygenase [Deinococcus roseus]GGJ41351.1 hypothetical protein GCM10008938_29280 [Deinococcus roseus]